MNINDISEQYPEALKADGFDNCIIGVTTKGCIAYNANAMIDQMVEKDGMSYEEAIEFFDYNIDGAYVGEYTPTYVWI
jgi:hypothetical protein